MENITIAPQERKSLIIEMKREAKPSRRLRMHIALLAFDGLSPTEIARVLFCSRTTVYAVVSRFLREGRAAFDDHGRRGPRPLLGEKASERLEKLLDHLRRTYRCHKELHLATDNDGSHTSKRVRRYVEDSGGRIRLYPLPSWSPESNPVEVVWWSLHEAVSRNHECAGLDDLVELAEGYLEEGQPFRLKLGEVYDRLERPPP
jgi:transposase